MSMFRALALAIAAAITLSAGAARAQDAAPVPPDAGTYSYPVPIYTLDLPPAPNGVAYRLYIRPPLSEPPPGEKAATVYFTDALLNMTPAGIMAVNYELRNYTPSAYFVGIGYRDGSADRLEETDRTRDYTPTAFQPGPGHFLESSPESWQGSGGAEAFFDYVEATIIPLMEARYGVDPHERMIVGKSMGGLAVTYALIERPGLFNRHLIISPSIWWDDWTLPRQDRWVMRAVAANAARDYPVETRVYFAVGAAEERLGLVTDLYLLADALRHRPGANLKVQLEVMPNLDHGGAYPEGFMRGFLGLYSDRRDNASQIRW